MPRHADPLHDRLLRAVQTSARTRLVLDFVTASSPAQLTRAALARGVNVRSMHTLHAAAHPERLAIVDARRSYTWLQLEEAINRCAHLLRDAFGVGPGAPVVLALQNRAEYIICWMAAFRLGAPTVHTSWRSSAEELSYQLTHSRACLLVCDASSVNAARQAADALAPLALLYVADDEPAPAALPELNAKMRGRSVRAPEASSAPSSDNVVYTSGTTGRPKGATRNFGRFGADELFRVLEHLPLEAGERHLIVSPLYHSGAQVFALMMTALGATIHMEPHFDAARTLETLSRWNIHSVFMVPTMIRRMTELPDALFERWPLSSLRAILSGAAPFEQALRERAIQRFGAQRIFDFYGATEVGWVTLIRGDAMLAKPGSVGKPIAGQEVTILDERMIPCPTGHPGTIYIRNHQLIEQYLHDDEATSSARHRDWFTVEDTGHLDSDGYLFISGRKRDMVISGGVNIYPVEIEEALARHPSIREVAVIGVPDETWGEALLAVVCPLPGRWPDTEQLEAFARLHLSSYKVPRRWQLLDEELPRNPTGKVLKRALRERFAV
jgi:acyl-CoA synthetase (AMP-forming)/AMP-acid ligase II